MRKRRTAAFFLTVLILLSGCAQNVQENVSSDSADLSAAESSAYSQMTAEEELDGYGSGKRLTGSCTAVLVFVDDPQAKWSDEAKSKMTALCQKATRYLVNQAKQYDVALELNCGGEYTLSCTMEETIPTEITDFEWTVRVQKQADYDAFCKEKKLQNVVFLLLVPKEGRSYSLPYSDGISTDYYKESVVIYAGDSSDTSLPATIAHEMLHPFGADDLYFPYDTDTARAELAKEYFPDDIMLRVDPLLSTLTIGAYTAYKVGWTDSLDPKYEVFLAEGSASEIQR